MLRHLDAMLVVMDKKYSFIISGDGNVIEPDGDVVTIGSGGGFAHAAASAYLHSTKASQKKLQKILLSLLQTSVYIQIIQYQF